MVERFLESEQNMLAFFGSQEVELRAARHDHFAMLEELGKYSLERESLRHAIDERHEIEVKGLFELGVFV